MILIQIIDNTKYNVIERMYNNIKIKEFFPIREENEQHEINENITIQCVNFLKKYKHI